MDYLKKIANQFGGKIKSQETSSKNFKEKSFRVLVKDDIYSAKIYMILSQLRNIFKDPFLLGLKLFFLRCSYQVK